MKCLVILLLICYKVSAQEEEPSIVIVDGENYNEEVSDNVTILNFSKTTGNVGNIDIILNFPNLEELYIDKYSLTKLPILANLKNLIKISLMGNNLEVITNASFSTSNLEIIYLARNQINEIYPRTFGPKTRELFLTCNDLKFVSSKWFTVPKNLHQLNLAGNKIRTILKDTFQDFSTLEHLDLRLNQLVNLEDDSLQGPPLKRLFLSYNNLTEFRGAVFGSSTDVVHLTYFEIKYNWISYITDDFLNKLKVDSFRIWANPWQCACKLKLENWWFKNNKNNTEDLAFDVDTPCITPLTYRDYCVPWKENYIYEEFLKIFLPKPLRLCGKGDR